MNLKNILKIWFKTTVNVIKGKVLTVLGVVVVKNNLQLNLKRTDSPVFFKGLRIKVGRGG